MILGPLYTKKEDKLLKALWPEAPRKEVLAKIAPRTWPSLKGRASVLGVFRSNKLNEKWRGRPFELLKKHFPSKGPYYVAALLGKGYTPDAVRAVAKRNGIELLVLGLHRKPKPSKPLVIEAVDMPKPEAKVLPKKEPRPRRQAAPKPVKRSPNTPNLNAQVARRKKEATTPLSEILSAMKKASCPPDRRMAFTKAAYHGMPAAIKAWDEWPNQQQAA